MQCPVDGERLVMTERSGVEVDYCPRCRGVWLDRGELDKIIERVAEAAPPAAAARVQAPPPAPEALPPREADRRHYDDDDDDRRRYGDDPRYRKRKSLLGDIFDF